MLAVVSEVDVPFLGAVGQSLAVGAWVDEVDADEVEFLKLEGD
jgi:hypothetical protein